MLLVFVKTAGAVCGMVFGVILALVLSEMHNDDHIRKLRSEGYDTAVRDIMRYGFYYGEDGERHEVENIRIWSD